MKKLTTEQFIEKSRKIHGDRYDYSLVEYNGTHKKIKIICKEHGIFEQEPSSHLNGNACRLCFVMSKNSNTGEFIEKTKKINGDRYDYSLVEYISANDKVKIICLEHGVFEQAPKSHLEGQNCPKCNVITNEMFIEKAKEIHNDKYDYSLVEYINNHTKLKIICQIHGIFNQTPTDHYKGECPKCANIIRAKNAISSTEKFVEKAKEMHNDK